MKKQNRAMSVVGFLTGLAISGVTLADNGVTEKSVTVGQAAALKGAASALGEGMQNGMTAYFNRVNAAGGVNGRKIELKSVNDGYEPANCEKATKVLVESDKVFGLIGYVGTPTAKVAAPIAIENKTPFIGAFTGAELLRTPHNQWVVNLRASYNQEMEQVAAYLVEGKGFKKVACFYQNDAFGQAGLTGIEAALKKRGIELVAKGSFERNTLAVNDALNTIAASKPDAIVTVAPYKPAAAFIKSVRGNEAIKGTTLTAISFVGTQALLNELNGQGDGVIISQVVPFPWDNTTPVVKDYAADMAAAGFGEKIDYITLEGYLTAKLFCQVLSKVEGEPTREKFINTLTTTATWDLGGFSTTFGPSDNQGSDQVWLTAIQGTKTTPIGGKSNVAGVNEK